MRARQQAQELAGWIGREARERSGDISLVMLYGSFITGGMHRHSDLDCVFVPKTEAGESFSQTFIIGDIGYDIFDRQWSDLEGMLSLHDHLLVMLDGAQLVHWDSPEDLARYRELQRRFQVAKADPVVCRAAAQRYLDEAAATLATVADPAPESLHPVTCAQHLILGAGAEAIARAHHHFFTHGHQALRAELSQLPGVSSRALAAFDRLADAAPEAVASSAHDCLSEIASALDLALDVGVLAEGRSTAAGHPQTESWADLTGLFEEMQSTFMKVVDAIDGRDARRAKQVAVSLQIMFNELAGRPGHPNWDCLAHASGDPSRWRASILTIASEWEQTLRDHGVPIRRHATVEEFVAPATAGSVRS